jgi:hypothetical protein
VTKAGGILGYSETRDRFDGPDTEDFAIGRTGVQIPYPHPYLFFRIGLNPEASDALKDYVTLFCLR